MFITCTHRVTHIRKQNIMDGSHISPHPSPRGRPPDICRHTVNSAMPELYRNGAMHRVPLCVWLLLLTRTSVRFIQIGAEFDPDHLFCLLSGIPSHGHSSPAVGYVACFQHGAVTAAPS